MLEEPSSVYIESAPSHSTLREDFVYTRNLTCQLAAPLAIEDQVVQSMPDASPTKWHLAHMTWFFENFILVPYCKNYKIFDANFRFLFNSYYEGVGTRHARPERGLITRPSVSEVLEYRRYVDDAMNHVIDHNCNPSLVGQLTRLGVQHEQQHQELMLMDILNLFSRNPTFPSYEAKAEKIFTIENSVPAWRGFEGGLYDIGHNGAGFAFDNESPLHRVFLEPFELSDRLVTNEEWLEFISEGGYERPEFWLSDGIEAARSGFWKAPLYWRGDSDVGWYQMTLYGMQPIDPKVPVSHVSFFEADAFARWSGARLPTESEWEVAAFGKPVTGNTLGNGYLRPLPFRDGMGDQMFGDLWEWTASPYVGYPGFTPSAGPTSEYNGKFMSGQMVLRGGACITPDGHLRSTYRNFFYPHQRWVFSGIRLARDSS